MADRIKIEIDEATINAVLGRLQGATVRGTGGGTVGGGAQFARGSVVPGTGHISAPRQQYAGGVVQAQPGGMLPSIPRGIRTTMGVAPGGYEMVAGYQKILWLEQGLTSVANKGLSVAAMMELYTFAILILIDVLSMIESIKADQEQNKRNIMAVSDVSLATYREWEIIQKNPYRGRKG